MQASVPFLANKGSPFSSNSQTEVSGSTTALKTELLTSRCPYLYALMGEAQLDISHKVELMELSHACVLPSVAVAVQYEQYPECIIRWAWSILSLAARANVQKNELHQITHTSDLLECDSDSLISTAGLGSAGLIAIELLIYSARAREPSEINIPPCLQWLCYKALLVLRAVSS